MAAWRARRNRRASTTAAMREERKVVTALFADLVGSTALGERLDPEEVKLVVGEAVARIVREVEALGGHVKDLAGDGVLAFFGAPVASEDDAERAVRAGLRIVEELGAYGREVEQAWGIEGLSVRVGLGTGRVVLGAVGGGSRVEYGAFGDTVNLAARLQSAAEPGTVLVDEATARAVEGVVRHRRARGALAQGQERPRRRADDHACPRRRRATTWAGRRRRGARRPGRRARARRGLDRPTARGDGRRARPVRGGRDRQEPADRRAGPPLRRRRRRRRRARLARGPLRLLRRVAPALALPRAAARLARPLARGAGAARPGPAAPPRGFAVRPAQR